MKKERWIAIMAIAISMCSHVSAQLIAEFESNPPGADPATQSVELSGTAGAAFSGYFLAIETDSGAIGGVDSADAVSGTFDSNGLLSVSVPDWENPSLTLLLVDTFSGSQGDDLDTNDDGTLDLNPWTTVYDAISIVDSGSDIAYASQVGGTDFAYSGAEPERVFRDASVGDWYAVNLLGDNASIFDALGNNVAVGIFSADPSAATNFGSINQSAIPEPSTFALIIGGVLGLFTAYSRRKARC